MAKSIPWPRKGDKVFAGADDWWNNACLRFSMDDLALYADGYKEAADIVARHVDRHRRSQDFLVYPIAFLYRHHVELELKLIIRDGSRLLDQRRADTGHHKLGALWREARGLIEKVWPKGPKADLDAAEDLIQQFEKIDPYSTAFRYHRDRKGQRSLPREISHINLRHLSEVMGRLSSLLNGVNCGLSAYLDSKSEMESYYGS